MVTNNNLNGAIELAELAKKLVEKRTMTYMEVVETLRDKVWWDERYIMDMITRHDGASIYFFDAGKRNYRYEISIFPENELLLTIGDMNQMVGYVPTEVYSKEL